MGSSILVARKRARRGGCTPIYAAGCERRVRSGSDFGHVVVIGQGLPAGADHVHALIGH